MRHKKKFWDVNEPMKSKNCHEMMMVHDFLENSENVGSCKTTI